MRCYFVYRAVGALLRRRVYRVLIRCTSVSAARNIRIGVDVKNDKGKADVEKEVLPGAWQVVAHQPVRFSPQFYDDPWQ